MGGGGRGLDTNWDGHHDDGLTDEVGQLILNFVNINISELSQKPRARG